jgi:gliding motility-associated-like protein
MYRIIILLIFIYSSLLGHFEKINDESQIINNLPFFNKIQNLYFIENKGQWHDDVLFLCRMSGLDAWITKYGVNYNFYKVERKDNHSFVCEKQNTSVDDKTILGHRVLFELQGGNLNPIPEGRHKQEGYHNYFIGNNPSKHATHVGLYKEVWVKNVYDGIDMRYYFDEGFLRFDFVIHPGADPSNISFKLNGAEKTYLKGEKKLAFTTCFGEVLLTDLRTFQEGKEVESRFIKNHNVWKVLLGRYNLKKPLIIDPLIYSTYIGGTNSDVARAIKVDASGNAYISGYSSLGGYDITSGAYQPIYKGGNTDGFVTKLNNNGSQLVYSTYLGGNGNDTIIDLFLDNSNNVHLVGASFSTNFPTTPTAFQTSLVATNFDGFITKLNYNGSQLIYSSLLGGNGMDGIKSVFVNNSGEAYVTGYTNSTNFTVTPISGVLQNSLSLGQDAFVAKINASGSSVLLSTYLGGNGTDVPYAIRVDNSGNVYVAGKTSSTNFPLANPTQNINKGNFDVMFCKITPNFNSFLISTYLGGSNADECHDMEINNANEIYLTGITTSSNFTTTAGCYDNSNNGGGGDCFLTKLNSNGSVSFSTFFGGTGHDTASGLELDVMNNIYITGFTTSTNLPVQFPIQPSKSTTSPTEADAFVTKFNASGDSLIYSTYLGGSNDEFSWDIAIDNTTAYITGLTGSNNFDVTSNVFQNSHGGMADVFVTKFCPEQIPVVNLISPGTTNNQTVCVNASITPVTYSAAASSTAFFLGLPSGVSGSYNSGSIIINGTPVQAGNYVYSVNVIGASCSNKMVTGTLNVIQGPQAGTINTSGSINQSVCVNQSITPITLTLNGVLSASVSGLPTGVGHTVSAMNPQILIAGTPSQSGTFVYTITLVGTQCNKIYTSTLHVTPPLSYSLLSVSSATYQSVCVGSSVQPVIYSVNGVTSASFNGLPSGINGSFNSGSLIISGTPTVSGYFYYTANLIGGCGNASINGIIDVKPQPTFSITGGSLFQNVCIGSGIQNITLNTPPLASINVSGLPTGVSFYAITNGGVISGTPNVPPTTNVFSISVQNECGLTQQTGTFVINSGNATALQLSPPGTENQIVCESDSIKVISYSVSGISSVTVTGMPPGLGYTLAPGICNIQGLSAVSGTYVYQLTAYGCSNNTAIKHGTITVLPSFSLSINGNSSVKNQTVCLGKPIEDIEYIVVGNQINTVNVLGLPANLEYDFDISIGQIKIEGTPGASGSYIYTVSTPGACLKNNMGVIKVEECTKLNIPSGVTGNGLWYIENIEQYPENEVLIFGRWGNKIAHIKGYNNKDKAWGSVQNPINVPEGTYYYVISLKDKNLKGYVEVLR